MTQTPAASAIAPASATNPGGAGRLPPGALVLVADIGGTNTRLALARDGALLADTIRRFANADHARPEAVFHAYLDALKAEGKLERPAPGAQPGTRGIRGIRAVVVAIAGVIEAGVARMTNLGWELSEAALIALTGAEYSLIINDLQAQGHALAHLKPAALETLWPGEGAAPGATRLVVGLGTGFNACPVHRLAQGGGQVFIPASETGQADLALLPARAGRDTADLAAFLADGRPGPRIEDLLCGPGLARAYRYFSATGAASAVSPAQVTAAA
ncbi:MAG TPA: hypothetical protein ENK41_05115, partial [Rhodobacteraceae bacterium]|nr:hypothetical protein [Paracoccaceae bacterium]